MDKQKEIVAMKQIICSAKEIPCSDCPFRFNGKCAAEKNAELLVNAGYGDVKQAVREFAERLKERLAQKKVDLYNGKSQVIQIDVQISLIIDELVKEVCGEWTN